MNLPQRKEFQPQSSVNFGDLVRQATRLSRAQLSELRDAIEALMALDVIDLDQARQDRETQTNPKPDAKGWYEHVYKNRGGKRYGPYCYFRYRTGGKKKSTYIGKALATPLT